MKLRLPAAIMLIAALLCGCASKQSIPKLTGNLANKGFVVARIYVAGLQGMENAGVDIDGATRPASVRDGYIVVPLEAGNHQLKQIRANGQLLSQNTIEESSPFRVVKGGGGTHYIYIPGSSYVIHSTTLSLDRSFNIEPGKVTNLGLIVYTPTVIDNPNVKRAQTSGSRDFNIFALDNTTEISTFLSVNYPEQFGALKASDIALAPAKYLEATNFSALRRMIAYFERLGPHVVHSPDKHAIYGRAGTVVVMGDPAQASSAPPAEVIDTGTLADIVGGVFNEGQFTFLTSDAKLLVWDVKQLAKSALPYPVQPVALNSLGTAGMLAIDNRMRIFTTHGRAEPWKAYEGALLKTARSDIVVAPDSGGAYVALGDHGMPEALYYVDAGTSLPVAIERPNQKPQFENKSYRILVARESGLFVLFPKSDFYFWSKTTRHWNQYTNPSGNCKPIKLDDDGLNLSIECDGHEYRSQNSGATWMATQI